MEAIEPDSTRNFDESPINLRRSDSVETIVLEEQEGCSCSVCFEPFFELERLEQLRNETSLAFFVDRSAILIVCLECWSTVHLHCSQGGRPLDENDVIGAIGVHRCRACVSSAEVPSEVQA